jgi:hypothetical protein
VNVVRLSDLDQRLLAARFAEHGNSHRRMRGALLEAGGSVPDTHPVERLVLDFITEVRLPAGGAEESWVHPDRVAQVRDLMDGRLVGEPDA